MDSLRVEYLLGRIQAHFKRINNDKYLTDADKDRVKTFYLEQFIAPEAREVFVKHYPEYLKNSVVPAGQASAGSRKRTP